MKHFFITVLLISCPLGWSAEQANTKLPLKEINKFVRCEDGNKVTISFFYTLDDEHTGGCAKYLDCNEHDLSKQYSYTQQGAFVADNPEEWWYKLFHAYDALQRNKKKYNTK